MTLETARLALPQLAMAQAQKEMTHNEALVLLDAAVQAVVVAVAPPALPSAPVPGQCWIVGAGAGGEWAGHEGALAVWTAGGWRFIAPFEGMAVWSLADSATAVRTDGEWAIGRLAGSMLSIDGVQVVGPRQPAIADPVGGSVVDVDCRAATVAILSALRTHGLVAE
jgi:hypothetical protein